MFFKFIEHSREHYLKAPGRELQNYKKPPNKSLDGKMPGRGYRKTLGNKQFIQRDGRFSNGFFIRTFPRVFR
jgi:hypothetical protein